MMKNMKPFSLIYIAVFVLVGVSCQQKRSHVCEISIDVSQDAGIAYRFTVMNPIITVRELFSPARL